MRRFRRAFRSVRRHHKLAVILFVIGLMINSSYFAYSQYINGVNQRNSRSHMDAQDRAQEFDSHGGSAHIVTNPDGTSNVQFPASLHDSATGRDCLSYVLTKANGSVITGSSC